MLIKNHRLLIPLGPIVLFVVMCGPLAMAAASEDGLVGALKIKYPITETSPDRSQIAQAGIVMRVVKSGINARPWDSLMSFDNLIVDGAVQQHSRWVGLTQTTEARLGQGKNLLILRPGDKVYISRIESKAESKDDLLTISILSCDPLPVDDGASQKRYTATLSFKMPKNSLAESAPDQVEQMVEAMLAPDSNGPAASNNAAASAPPTQPQAAAPPSQHPQSTKAAQALGTSVLTSAATRFVPFGGTLASAASAARAKPQAAAPASQATASTPAAPTPVAPTPVAPTLAAPTQNITLGETVQQVVADMGPPKQIVDLGAKKIYTYPLLKIVFMNGKVSDVQ
jgi:hypothetical protein